MLQLTALCVSEPDEGTSRILYITDEAVYRLIWPNSPRCIRLRHIY